MQSQQEATRSTIVRRMIIAGAIVGAFGVSVSEFAHAQEARRGGIFRRVFHRRHTTEQLFQNSAADQGYGVYQVQNETEQPLPPTEETPAMTEQPPAPAYESAAEKAEGEEAETPPTPWTLTDLFTNDCGENCLKENQWTISGYSQWGYQDRPDGAFTGNGPFLNQQEWDQFNLNQEYLYIERKADGKKGIDWGVRFDVFYGVDGNEGQSFGNNPGRYDYLNGFDHGAYEWALPQLYAEVALGEKWNIKGGHFYTIVGYEVIPSTGQFFLSRQLTFWNSEPFTHTGGLATYKATDKLNVLAGWVFGMDTGFDQLNGGNSFLGGFTYQIDEKTAFVYSMIGGNLGWRGEGAINSWILSRQWTKKFSTVHQFDVLDTNLRQANGQPADFRDPNSFIPRDSTGFINYAFYDITDKVKAGIRFEWFKADATSYYTLTGGVNFKPYSWLLIRPEVRGMWSPGNQDIYTGAHGFSGKLFNQTVFGVDAIVIF